MSDTFANEFFSVYFTGNLSSPSPHQASCCGNLGSIVITYESVCRRLSTLNVEASMGLDGFHPKLLSSCQAVAYPIYLIYKNSLPCGQLLAQWKESFCHSPVQETFSLLTLQLQTDKPDFRLVSDFGKRDNYPFV